jgi:hypothetical protein
MTHRVRAPRAKALSTHPQTDAFVSCGVGLARQGWCGSAFIPDQEMQVNVARLSISATQL